MIRKFYGTATIFFDSQYFTKIHEFVYVTIIEDNLYIVTSSYLNGVIINTNLI